MRLEPLALHLLAAEVRVWQWCRLLRTPGGVKQFGYVLFFMTPLYLENSGDDRAIGTKCSGG